MMFRDCELMDFLFQCLPEHTAELDTISHVFTQAQKIKIKYRQLKRIFSGLQSDLVITRLNYEVLSRMYIEEQNFVFLLLFVAVRHVVLMLRERLLRKEKVGESKASFSSSFYILRIYK